MSGIPCRGTSDHESVGGSTGEYQPDESTDPVSLNHVEATGSTGSIDPDPSVPMRINPVPPFSGGRIAVPGIPPPEGSVPAVRKDPVEPSTTIPCPVESQIA